MSSSSSNKEHPVYVYIYDLSQGMARMLSGQILGRQLNGIWHTAIVVFNKEFAFGQGVSAFPSPGHTPYGSPVERHFLGNTSVDEDTFLQFIHDMRHRFNEYSYDLLENNCNNFSQEAAVFLTGNSIPDYVRNLTRDVIESPGGQMLKPFLDQFRNPHGLGHQSLTSSGSYPVPLPSAQPAAASTKDRSKRAILFTVGNLSGIKKKLKEFVEAKGGASAGVEEDVDAKLGRVEECVKETEPLEKGLLQWLVDLMALLPEANLFPVMDLLRLTFICPSNAESFVEHHDALDRVFALVKETSSAAIRLTGLRLLVNLFSSDKGAALLRTDLSSQSFSCATVSMAPEQPASCKECACALGFNLVLGQELEASDHELELISGVCMALDSTEELKASAAEKMLEFVLVMLQNETHRDLWDTMQVDLDKVLTVEGATPALQELVDRVQEVLKQHKLSSS